MNILLIVYLGFLSLFIIGFIHYTEEKVNNYRLAMEDYKRALSIAKGSQTAEHYTYLQVQNAKLRSEIDSLRKQTEAFIQGQPIQYESSRYQSSLWESYNQDKLDLDQ